MLTPKSFCLRCKQTLHIFFRARRAMFIIGYYLTNVWRATFSNSSRSKTVLVQSLFGVSFHNKTAMLKRWGKLWKQIWQQLNTTHLDYKSYTAAEQQEYLSFYCAKYLQLNVAYTQVMLLVMQTKVIRDSLPIWGMLLSCCRRSKQALQTTQTTTFQQSLVANKSVKHWE